MAGGLLFRMHMLTRLQGIAIKTDDLQIFVQTNNNQKVTIYKNNDFLFLLDDNNSHTETHMCRTLIVLILHQLIS